MPLQLAKTRLENVGTYLDEQKVQVDGLHAEMAGLKEPVLLVFVGEFNAGKSSLINKLVKDNRLEIGVRPTTNCIWILRHGRSTTRENRNGYFEIFLESEVLRKMSLVDTPGLNSSARDDALTTEFIRKADLVLFVMSAESAFRDTEKEMLQYLREQEKRVAIVINKWDLLTPDQQETLKVTITGKCKEIFPRVGIFTVSASNDDPMEHLTDFLTEISNRGSLLKIEKALQNARKLVDEKVMMIEEKKNKLLKSTVWLDGISQSKVVVQESISRFVAMQLKDIEQLCKNLQENMLAFIEGDPKRCRGVFWQSVADVFVESVQQIIQDVIRKLEAYIKRQNGKIDNACGQNFASWNGASNIGFAQKCMLSLAKIQNELDDRVRKAGCFTSGRVEAFGKTFGSASTITRLFMNAQDARDRAYVAIKEELTRLLYSIHEGLAELVTSSFSKQEERIDKYISHNKQSIEETEKEKYVLEKSLQDINKIRRDLLDSDAGRMYSENQVFVF